MTHSRRAPLVPSLALVASLLAGCAPSATTPGAWLYVWAGDSAAQASDFLAVVDADPSSAHYGSVVRSLPIRVAHQISF